MKNKKMWAIAILVAFMMTLIPMAAFAADRHASLMIVNKTAVEADGESKVKFTVYVRESNNSNAAGETIYVASERGTTDRFFEMGSKNAKPRASYYAFTDEDRDGKIEFQLSSSIAGKARVAVGLKNNVYTYLTDSRVTASAAEIIDTETITFEATKASDIELVKVEPRGGASIANLKEQSQSKEGDRLYGTRTNMLQGNDIKANDLDYYELTFVVRNSSGAPVEGETVTFTPNRDDVSFNKQEATTNVVGEVSIRATADKSGVYEVEASLGKETARVWLGFGVSEINDIALAGKIDELITVNEKDPGKFKLELRDATGSKINPSVLGLSAIDRQGMLEFEWITEPSGSRLDDNWVWEQNASGYKYITITGDDYLEVTIPELDEEGRYVLRIYTEGGKYVDVRFEGKEQGRVVGLELSYDTKALQLGSTSSAPVVKRIDREGVAVEVPGSSSSLNWSISDYRVLQAGKKDLTKENGVLNIIDDEDYIGTYTVTVVDRHNNLTAKFEVIVGSEVTGINIDQMNTLPVGKESQLTVKLIDANGNNIALGTDVKEIEVSSYISSQPAGARLTVEPNHSEERFATDLKEKGRAEINVFSREAGAARVVLVITITDADGNDKNFTRTMNLNFGDVKEPAAKALTLFIGQEIALVDGESILLDVAPFIKDNRTFVPFRFVGEALGADVKWDASSQTVTATRGEDVIALTIGSNRLTVNGKTEATDVAPFITEGNRTVLPFRAVAEAFGIDVKWDATNQSVVFGK